MDLAAKKKFRFGKIHASTQQLEILRELSSAIIAGRFKPGEKLSVRSIADEFGVGTMPVRESVIGLVGRGVIKRSANRNAEIPTLDRNSLEELYEIRNIVEALALRKAVELISAKELAELRSLNRRMRKAIPRVDVFDYLLTNYEFHFLIYGASKSPYLVQLIETIWLQVSPLVAKVLESSLNHQQLCWIVEMHEDLTSAISARDVEGSTKLLAKMFDHTRNMYLKVLAKESS